MSSICAFGSASAPQYTSRRTRNRVVKNGNLNCAQYIPDAGFLLEDVVVDGVSQGSITEYVFIEVNKEHTVKAKFIPDSISPEKPINLRIDSKGSRSTCAEQFCRLQESSTTEESKQRKTKPRAV